MRLLLDANLSARVARLLRERGSDAMHIRDLDLQHADDATIFDHAAQHGFVLVSEDTDFGELLARRRARTPSLVLLRTGEPMPPDRQAALLDANLPAVADDLADGAVVVIARGRVRVRPLPLHPGL